MAHAGRPLTGLEEQIRSFILEELGYQPTRPLGAETPLFEALLDSTSVLALVEHLEQKFQIQIEDYELVPDNFSTLGRIAEMVERKRRPAESQLAANMG